MYTISMHNFIQLTSQALRFWISFIFKVLLLIIFIRTKLMIQRSKVSGMNRIATAIHDQGDEQDSCTSWVVVLLQAGVELVPLTLKEKRTFSLGRSYWNDTKGRENFYAVQQASASLGRSFCARGCGESMACSVCNILPHAATGESRGVHCKLS